MQPLHLDGPSRPALLRGARAGIELACTSCVMGFVGGEGRGGGEMMVRAVGDGVRCGCVRYVGLYYLYGKLHSMFGMLWFTYRIR